MDTQPLTDDVASTQHPQPRSERPPDGADPPRHRLAQVLTELGWSAARLAQAVNAVLGPGYVARSSVAGWVSRGRVPRPPVPTVTATILADALGRTVPADWLWGRETPCESHAPAHKGLPTNSHDGITVAVATQWARDGSDMRRRSFLAISGSALFSAAVPPVTAAPKPVAARTTTVGEPVVTPAVADTIKATVEALRRLDDVEGGDLSTLDHVHRHFTLIARTVRLDRYVDSAARARTIHLWAQLAQTAGWMAMDAGLHGLAQRYYLTGLAASREVDDPALISHLLGCLTFQAVIRGRLRDAVDLANAGIDAARTAPPATQALAAARHAHAHAALGDIHGLRHSTDVAFGHLAHSEAIDTRPPWLYWLSDLSVVTSQSFITAGLSAGIARSARGTCLLVEADPPMTAWLGAHAEHTTDRDALLHGAWLARSYLSRDRVDHAVATVRSLLAYASTVRSTCTHDVLREFDEDLAERRDLRGRADVADLRALLKRSWRHTASSSGTAT